MVLQKGQAVAMVCGAGGDEFGGADVADALAGFFAEEGEAAAGSATEAALVVARGFDEFAGEGDDGARLVVDIAIAAEVAGVVVDDLFARFWLLCGSCVGEAGQEFAVVLDLGRRAVLLPVFLDGADAVRADGDDLLDLVLREGFEVGFGELLEERDRCRGGGRGRRCIFPCAGRRSWCRGSS